MASIADAAIGGATTGRRRDRLLRR